MRGTKPFGNYPRSIRTGSRHSGEYAAEEEEVEKVGGERVWSADGANRLCEDERGLVITT